MKDAFRCYFNRIYDVLFRYFMIHVNLQAGMSLYSPVLGWILVNHPTAQHQEGHFMQIYEYQQIY